MDIDRAGLAVGNHGLREEHAPHVVLDQVALHLFGVEQSQQLVRRLDAESAQHHGNWYLLAVIDLDGNDSAGRQIELHPGAAIRYQFRQKRLLPRDAKLGAVINAGRSRELVDNDAFSAVDDERSPLCHSGEISKVNFLFLDLAGLSVR